MWIMLSFKMLPRKQALWPSYAGRIRLLLLPSPTTAVPRCMTSPPGLREELPHTWSLCVRMTWSCPLQAARRTRTVGRMHAGTDADAYCVCKSRSLGSVLGGWVVRVWQQRVVSREASRRPVTDKSISRLRKAQARCWPAETLSIGGLASAPGILNTITTSTPS